MGGSIAEWFNSIVNYGVSIIWGNNDWLIASNPWYGLLMFLLLLAALVGDLVFLPSLLASPAGKLFQVKSDPSAPR